jgi:RNA polymerase sigma-70 factor (ECF subfamily)
MDAPTQPRSQPDSQPDGELMARMARGDREAFAVLVDRYKDDVVHYLTRLLGRREPAEEIAQDTFLRLFEAAARYREEGKFQAFLYRVATNLARSHERRERLHRGVVGTFALLTGSDSWPGRSVEPSHEARFLALEAGRALERAIADLPMAFRVPLILFAVEGWSQRAIAEFLGCGEPTVKTRIHRARERLKTRLAPHRAPRVARAGGVL